MKYYILEKDNSVKAFKNKETFYLELKKRIDVNSSIKSEIMKDQYLRDIYSCFNPHKCYTINFSSLRAFEKILDVYILDEKQFSKLKIKGVKNEPN